MSEPHRIDLENFLLDFDRRWHHRALSQYATRIGELDPAVRNTALEELVKVDLERRWTQHIGRLTEDYLHQFPELGSRENVSVDILLAEFLVRREFDPSLDIEQFEERFPTQFQSLKQRVEQFYDTLSRVDGGINDRLGTDRPHETHGVDASDGHAEMPELFGRYRMIRKLGDGAMGFVYLAYDEELSRDVALKTPKFTHGESEEMIRRFYREARSAARLRHANICPIFDVGESDGIHFITMAYIEGMTLAEHVSNNGRLTNSAAAGICMTLALALSHAHRRGVIHRDLKPANVMLDINGEPVLMDFGLAVPAADPRITTAGMVGTPAYMSPEQLIGTNEVSAASDIYSLGTILYELITGELPFTGSLASVIDGVLNKTPRSPSTICEGVDPDLEVVCLKMMAKRTEDRFRTMDDVAESLSTFLRRPGDAVRKTKRPYIVATLAALLVTSVVLIASLWNDRGHLSGLESLQRSSIPPQKLTTAGFGAADKAPPELVGIFGDGRLMHWNKMYGASSVQFRDEDRTLVSASWDGNVAFWDATNGALKQAISSDTDGLFSLAQGLDGRTVAVGTGTGIAMSLDLTSGTWQQVGRTRSIGFVRSVRFHPNQPLLFSGSMVDREGWLLDLPSGVGRSIALKRPIRDAVFSRDGRWLATVGADSVARLFNVSTGLPEYEFQGQPGEFFNTVDLSPDGQWMVVGICNDVGKRGGQVIVYNVNSKKEERRLAADGGWVWSVRFSPDGRWLAESREQGQLNLWDVRRWRKIRTFDTIGYPTIRYLKPALRSRNGKRSTAFSETNRLLVSGGADNAIHVWDISKRPAQIVLTPDFGRLQSVALHPNGELIAAAGDKGSLGIWNLGTSESRVIKAHDQAIQSLAFGSKGDVLITGSDDSSVRFWDPYQGAKLAIPPFGASRGIVSVATHPSEPIVAIASEDGSVQAWNWAKHELVFQTEEKYSSGANVVAFSANGEWLAAGGTLSSDKKGTLPGGVVQIFAARDGALVSSFDQIYGVRALSFHPTENKIAVVTQTDGFREMHWLKYPSIVSVIDFSDESVEQMQEFPVVHVAYSNAGNQLVLSGYDGAIHVVDANNWENCRRIQLGPSRGVISQSLFGPRDVHVCTANHNGTVYVLRLNPLRNDVSN